MFLRLFGTVVKHLPLIWSAVFGKPLLMGMFFSIFVKTQVRQLIQLIKKSFATGEESSQHNPLGLYRHQSVDEVC